MIEKEINKIDNEIMPNVSLLLDMMRYLNRYVDIVQHPIEDLLIERLEKSPENYPPAHLR
ncbi:MAG: hemerythrin-like domain-containing protein [Parasphingorhabdus sp.]